MTAETNAAALAEMTARKDAAYLERNQVVAALAKCFPSGVVRTAIEGWSEDWHGCVYIDLPTGQVSWHFHDSQAHLFADLPPYFGTWDGHDTPEKYRRLALLRAGAAKVPDGVALAAKLIDEKAASYAAEFGHDDDGALSFGHGHHAQDKMDYYTGLIELADEVRALATPPAPDAGVVEPSAEGK